VASTTVTSGVAPAWVRRASSAATEPEVLAAELAAQLAPRVGDLVIVFAASTLEPHATARAVTSALAPATVVGCTAALGFADGDRSTVAVALSAPAVRFGVGVTQRMAAAPLSAGRAAVLAAAAALGRGLDQLDPERHVAISLVDGGSTCAEGFCLGSAASVPRIGMVGGSSSRMAEGVNGLFANGGFLVDAGLVIVLETDHRFAVIMSEHMQPTAKRVVVTAADPARRLVTELDGFPAAARYYQLVGELGATGPDDPRLPAAFPFAIYVDGRPYVRTVRAIDGDAISLAAAVDEGAVLRIMQPGDLVGSTARSLAEAIAQVGALELMLSFSCVARFLEAGASGVSAALGRVYAEVPTVGIHSFGEQIGPLLVNHTLVALALGRQARAS